ncbi:MAG: hypothetical protein ACRDTK_05000 [Mycobacterium sp.]
MGFRALSQHDTRDGFVDEQHVLDPPHGCLGHGCTGFEARNNLAKPSKYCRDDAAIG